MAITTWTRLPRQDYLDKQAPGGRFFSFLLLFMAAILGVVTADNLLLLVVFWELTSISSFLLIGYWSDQSAARKGARMALILTGAGGLALLPDWRHGDSPLSIKKRGPMRPSRRARGAPIQK